MACILTSHSRTSGGYGKLRGVGGRWLMAHRVAYATHHGLSIDDISGMMVRHTCDNPPCVNPAHLVIGTAQDNMDDKVARGRCPSGLAVHNCILTDEQVAEIRRRYTPRCPMNGGAALGREFNVTTTLACKYGKYGRSTKSQHEKE